MDSAADLALPRRTPPASAAVVVGEKAFHAEVESYKYSNWAREKQAKLANNAAVRYLSLRPFATVPDEL